MTKSTPNSFVLAITAMLVMLLCTFASTVQAQPSKSADFSVSVMSDYIWRGFNLGDKGALQPSVSLGYGGFAANLWANYDIDQTELTETDLTLSYAFDFNEKIDMEIGHIYYGLEGPDTQELFLSFAADTPLSPSLAAYWDFDQGDGTFLEASLAHSLSIDNMILNLGASAGYNLSSKFSIGDYNDFHNAALSASLTIPAGEDFTIEPIIAYTFDLSNDAQSAIETLSGDADFFYGGVTASLAF